jgi:hypothetical protein
MGILLEMIEEKIKKIIGHPRYTDYGVPRIFFLHYTTFYSVRAPH